MEVYARKAGPLSLVCLILFVKPTGAAPTSSEQIIVPSSATLYRHPDANAALPEARKPGRFDAAPYLTLHKIRDLASGWIEVETDCGYAIDYCNFAPSSIRVRLFVRSADVAPVLKRSLRARLPDGTWHNFPPGSPVKPGSTHARQIVTDEDREYEVAVPTSAIGRAYMPRPPQGRPIPSIFDRSDALGFDFRHFPAKTRLAWLDGSPAGRITKDEGVDSEPGDKACIRLLVGRAEELVCSDKSHIIDTSEAMDAAMKNPQSIP